MIHAQSPSFLRASKWTVVGMCAFTLLAMITIPLTCMSSNNQDGRSNLASLRGHPNNQIGIVSIPYGSLRADDTEPDYLDTVYVVQYNPFNQTESDWNFPSSSPLSTMLNISTVPQPTNRTSSPCNGSVGDDNDPVRDAPRRFSQELPLLQREPHERPSTTPFPEVASK